MQTLSQAQLVIVAILALLSFAFIVVNERYSTGLGKFWLTFQAILFALGTWMVRQPGPLPIMLLPLILSTLAGFTGFIFLVLGNGEQKFTQPIIPGRKR